MSSGGSTALCSLAFDTNLRKIDFAEVTKTVIMLRFISVMGLDAETLTNIWIFVVCNRVEYAMEYAGGILPVLQVSCQLLQSFTTDSSFIGLTHHSWTFYISIGRVFLHHDNGDCDKNLDDYDHHI